MRRLLSEYGMFLRRHPLWWLAASACAVGALAAAAWFRANAPAFIYPLL